MGRAKLTARVVGRPLVTPAKPQKTRIPPVIWVAGAVGAVALAAIAAMIMRAHSTRLHEAPLATTEHTGTQIAPNSGGPAGVAQKIEKGEMIRIPTGRFRMGSNEGDSDEMPVHWMTVASFQMDKTEVTVAAYRACVQAGKCTNPGTGGFCDWNIPGKDNHPINCVDGNQAAAYCAWAGGRLPTEQEWEYAARGTDGRKYPWGNSPPSNQLCWDRRKLNQGTCSVASFASGNSPFGLADMAGNVWEWTISGYSTNYSTDRLEGVRSIRGGSWGADDAKAVRAANRSGYYQTRRNDDFGFRCAR
jgi:formylglycine-generating enzyme required for sulfatase activity